MGEFFCSKALSPFEAVGLHAQWQLSVQNMQRTAKKGNFVSLKDEF
jgi:hypothetical protein